jgi:hypothetical protein
MAKNLGLSSQIVSNGGARVKWLAIVRALACASIVVGALLAARQSQAAPFDPSGNDWEGYSDFVRLIRAEVGDKRLVITTRLDWSTLTSQDALIMVYPDHVVSTTSAGAFVRAGGRLAVLDDFGDADALLESFDVLRVPLPSRPALALRDNPDLAIAEPADDHPLTRGVERVVTNHASGLSQPSLTTVLRVRGTDGAQVALALVASVVAGRLVAVGDPSIAMNSMLRYPGNAAFARNLVQYLTAGHGRGHVVLVVRSFGETGAFEGVTSPAQDWWEALAHERATLVREGMPPWTMYWLAFLLTSALLAWLLPRMARAYRGQAPRFTRPIALRAQGGVAGHAAALGAKDAYRGHAMLEWRRAFMEDLIVHFGLRRDVSSAEIVGRVARLGVVDDEAIHEVERVLLRMADIDTMVATKKKQALERVRDEEVVAAGKLLERVLGAVHQRAAKRA